MTPGEPHRFRLEDGSFLALLILVSVAFGFVIKPFFGAILWAMVLAILFGAFRRWLLRRMPGRNNVAAALTLIAIVLIVILPAILLGMALLQELTGIYQHIQSGQINIPKLFQQAMQLLPASISERLASFGWTDFSAARESILSGLAGSVKALAGQVLLVGQGTLKFMLMLGVTLYLSFFLLRDGDALAERVISAIPLEQSQREAIVRNFTVVIRATIKGSVVVAIVQGLIGGLVFWALGIEGALLWAVVMGIFSLIPAVGTGIVWVPVAVYLLASGAIAKGFILVFCGLFVIGLVDNILRPILVGRDTRMPDYVVLISTLGGLQVFGFHGFVIGPVVAALFIGIWNGFSESRNVTVPAEPRTGEQGAGDTV